MNRKLLPLVLVSGLLSAAAALAQETTAADSASGTASDSDGLDVVEITGSLIRSSEKVQFNQVQTITPEDIQATGSVTGVRVAFQAGEQRRHCRFRRQRRSY